MRSLSFKTQDRKTDNYETFRIMPCILSGNAGKAPGSAGTKTRIGHKQNVNFEQKRTCYKTHTKGSGLAPSQAFGSGQMLF
jgi:hypothetical protein